MHVIEHGAPGFLITRIDGTVEDFSYRKALAGKDFSQRTQVIKAMRRAVDDQTLEFRRQQFAQNQSPICPLTGLQLTIDPTTHVDHWHPTFVELAELYAEKVGGFDAITIMSDGVAPRTATDPTARRSVRRSPPLHSHPATRLSLSQPNEG